MAKKTLTITIYTTELIYDVQNKAYLTGRSRRTGDNHELVSSMQASDDEEDKNQIVRSLSNAFGTLKTKLAEYIDDGGTTADNTLPDASNLTVVLLMPSNYNEGTHQAIAAAIHQYLVNTATADWLRITDKADANDYATLADANLQELREAINKRVRPTRPMS